ncbi:hypothetical protein [Duganella sp. BuS-21]|uniref:hypothetical protein n=1 Tax=Duganella sp. BuS-21 TaxID=2943848 RepID=UPI0035A59935
MQIIPPQHDGQPWVINLDALPEGIWTGMKSVKSCTPTNSGIAGQSGQIHRIKSRQIVLDDEIALARKNALSPNCASSVFYELTKLAKKQYGCLISVDEDQVKYQAGGVVKFLSVRSLRKRLARANKRELH